MSALTVLNPLACDRELARGRPSPGGKRRRNVKCVLVDNFFHTGRHTGRPLVSPHLGLMLMAAVLEEAGHRVEIFDPKVLFAEENWRSGLDAGFLDASANRLTEFNA